MSSEEVDMDISEKPPSVASYASTSAASAAASDKKRKRSDEANKEIFRREKESLDDVESVILGLRLFFGDKHTKGSRTTKGDLTFLNDKFGCIIEETKKLSFENVAMRGRLYGIDLRGSESHSVAGPYKAALTSGLREPKVPPISGQKRRAPPKKKFSATVRIVDRKDETADDTKKKFFKALDPVKEKLHIDSLRRMRSGAILVETETLDDLNKIVSSKAITENGLEVNPLNRRLPRLTIYDVPVEFSEDEVKEALYLQNKELFEDLVKDDYNKDEFSKLIKLSFRMGKRNLDTINWVVEVLPVLRNILRRKEKVYIGGYRCRVVDFLSISRCYRCQGLGHIAKTCKEDKSTCRVCAGQDHDTKDCRAEKVTKFCALCKRLGKSDYLHLPDCIYSACPVYKSALELLEERTDYG